MQSSEVAKAAILFDVGAKTKHVTNIVATAPMDCEAETQEKVKFIVPLAVKNPVQRLNNGDGLSLRRLSPVPPRPISPMLSGDMVKPNDDRGILELDRTCISPSSDFTEGRLTGPFMSLMNMTKANLGTGILALPFAFKNSGLALGVVCVVIFGIVCTHCMQMLVDAARYFGRTQNADNHNCPQPTKRLSYPTVARLAFQHSPFGRWAHAVQQVTTGFIIVTQLGFCCVYIVFVARTVENILHEYKTAVTPINIRYIELMWAPLFLALALIRNLKRLAPLSTLANIVMSVSLLVVYQEEVRHLPAIWTRPQIGTFAGITRFFGTTVYAFACIACVLPVENKMRRPETFGGLFGILNWAMLIVTTTYAVTGFLGYWAYGDLVEGSITYNLPHNPVYMTTKLAMALSVYISYAIQLYVPVQIILSTIRHRFPLLPRKQQVRAEYALRVLLTFVTFGLALFIPHLAEFIALIGAFGSSYLALILPPVIDLVYRYGGNKINAAAADGHTVPKVSPYGRFYWRAVKNVAIIAFGLTGFVLGTYVALYDIVEQLKQTGTVQYDAALSVDNGTVIDRTL